MPLSDWWTSDHMSVVLPLLPLLLLPSGCHSDHLSVVLPLLLLLALLLDFLALSAGCFRSMASLRASARARYPKLNLTAPVILSWGGGSRGALGL